MVDQLQAGWGEKLVGLDGLGEVVQAGVVGDFDRQQVEGAGFESGRKSEPGEGEMLHQREKAGAGAKRSERFLCKKVFGDLFEDDEEQGEGDEEVDGPAPGADGTHGEQGGSGEGEQSADVIGGCNNMQQLVATLEQLAELGGFFVAFLGGMADTDAANYKQGAFGAGEHETERDAEDEQQPDHQRWSGAGGS